MYVKELGLQELGMDNEKIKVSEMLAIPEEELQQLYEEKESKQFEFVDIKDDGYSNGYNRSLVIIRKKNTEAYYRFLAITYEGYVTFTKASRVFLKTTTYTRESYTNILEKEKDMKIIHQLLAK